MSATKRKAAPDTFRVSESMTEDGTMLVSPLGRFAEYEVVDYTDPLVEKRLAGLSEGATVRLELAPTAPDARPEVVSTVRHRTMTDGGSSIDENDGSPVDGQSAASTGNAYVVTRVLPGTGVGTV